MATAEKFLGVDVSTLGKVLGLASPGKIMGLDWPSGFTYPYDVENSCLFVSGNSTYMTITPNALADQKLSTISVWVKRATLGIQYIMGVLNSSASYFGFTANDEVRFTLYNAAGTQYINKITTAVYRDVGQWLHIVLQVDTAQVSQQDRTTMWINGEKITDFSLDTATIAQSEDSQVMMNSQHDFGKGWPGSTNYMDAYLAEFVICEGVAYTASDFGVDTNGVWTPKDISGLTFGSYGFYLNFADAANLGNDVSGNNLDWTENNITSTNQSTDTPTNNFCTMNPLIPADGITMTMTEGNLDVLHTAGSNFCFACANMPVISGKWYWEAKVQGGTGSDNGIAEVSGPMSANHGGSGGLGYFATEYGYIWTGDKENNSSNTAYDISGSQAAGDIIMIALDLDNGKIWAGNKGVWGNSGDPTAGTNEMFSGLSGTFVPAMSTDAGTDGMIYNFGNPSPGFAIASGNADDNGHGNFEYAPPTGFMALCSANLQDGVGTAPVVGEAVRNEGFVITSDGYATVVASLEALRSGWATWIDVFKRSDSTSDWRIRFSDDSGNQLSWNLQDDKTAFANPSAEAGTWLGWSWQVGAEYGCATGTISHTNGSDTTGAHGLGVAPEFCITKPEDQNATDWYTYHKGLTANYNILLNSSAVEIATEYVAVDATNVTIKSAAPTGIYRYIAFVSIEGFSHFGDYTGNGVADGPFINCGFDPAIFMNKRVAVAAGSWEARELISNPSNPCDSNFRLETTDALVVSADYFDLVSNSTKIRSIGNARNNSGETYIAMAWAAQPFKYANAR